MKKIDKTAIIVLSVLFLLLASVILLGGHLPVKITCNFPSAGEQISPYGSIEFVFSRRVQAEKVEELLQTEPPVEGRWVWSDEKHARWYALQPMPAGQEITFHFAKGTAGKNDEEIKQDFTWTAQVRDPQILVLKDSENGKALYSLELNDIDSLAQLSEVEGHVYDYAVSPDGERIIFSVENEQNGLDLWMVNRDASGQEILLECGADRCSTPAWSADMQEIVYSRESLEYSLVNIWIMDVESGQTVSLFSDSELSGYDPTWSPDGNWLSIWISSSQKVQVVNRNSGEAFLLDSENGDTGSWSAGSDYLYYSYMISGLAGFHYVIRQADIDTQVVKTVIGGNVEGEGMSYSLPVCNPLDNWIAVKVQANTNLPGSELILINMESKEEITIMDDVSQIPSYYSWTPAGELLIYQTFQLGDDTDEVKIWYWDQNTQQSELILQGAQYPQWLP